MDKWARWYQWHTRIVVPPLSANPRFIKLSSFSSRRVLCRAVILQNCSYFVWRRCQSHWRCPRKCYRSHRWHMTHRLSPERGTGTERSESGHLSTTQTLITVTDGPCPKYCMDTGRRSSPGASKLQQSSLICPTAATVNAAFVYFKYSKQNEATDQTGACFSHWL